MATTNQERVGKAMELLRAGLAPFAERVGYDLMINSDEETGSHASARLIAELAVGKTAALTYEPALPDGKVTSR